ncbi:DUF1918 domain-containing protein [Actinoplanes teichomyceticus]|uniref:Uncharacterized protein DUF1918 n=1 Tax=Actinoplanes teichomyceticus TaxID=1867 RepID=A0A561VLS0_ACTTI|nr:DUF1918 domain-containing protein [Actinoplanes teichomyceticus]TWG12566.1 uncharacterized protein DUF1918 [Actinoplanes teichomyceticus]GIF13933.1 hypothetical protein Ate01nite_39650 [Actinoplanes teichomyceticus]
MKAHIGDRIIVAGVHVGIEKRVGVITGIEHPDGTPPYTVRWINDDHTSLFYPGPESRVEPSHRHPAATAP